jgi:hypothetical protein
MSPPTATTTLEESDDELFRQLEAEEEAELDVMARVREQRYEQLRRECVH